jgi:multiple sugar transport system substrate-binding protein
MWTQGKAPVEDGRINMDSPEALKTLETVKYIVDGCNMRNLTGDEAVSAFAAGELPLMYTSTSNVGRMMTIKADFDFETGAYPGIDGKPVGLPAGGNAAVMTSTPEDPAVREAARQ